MDNVIDEQIQCPVCGLYDCYKSEYGTITTYLCFSCGYTSNSKMKLNSTYVKEQFENNKNVAKFIKNIRFNDTANSLVWYPTVLQFPELGIIFPEPNGNDWNWTYAQEVPILEDEKEKFKIGDTDDYYKTKIDIENAKRYNKFDFKMACQDMGIIKPPQEEIN